MTPRRRRATAGRPTGSTGQGETNRSLPEYSAVQPGALCEDEGFDRSADWWLGGSLAVFAEAEIGASNGGGADPTLLLDSKEAETEVLESGSHGKRKHRAPKGQRRRPGRKPKRARPGDVHGDGPTAAGAPGAETPQVTVTQLRRMIAPAWGWRLPGAGRAAHVGSTPEFQATTTQACGLYPFLAGSGSPTLGVPQGRNLLFGDLVCYDPIQWVVEGLTTNPGCYILGQPGCGKSSFIKRQIRGMRGFGVIPWFLADIKGEYSTTVKRLEGRVITVGHGLDRLNPLDTGPLGEAALGATGSVREQLEAETRSRRLTCLLALLSLVREYKISNGEENVLAAALDALDEKMNRAPSNGRRLQPTVPDVLRLLRSDEQLDRLMQAADVVGEQEFAYQTRELRQTLNLLCEGSLKGVFDGQTSQPIDLRAPAVSVDISHLVSSGDVKVAAAILSTWSYAFSAIDGAAALAEQGKAPRRQFAVCLDEGWKALRGAPGLVELGDALTRLNRAKGVCNIWCTHTLADLEALPTEADRSKARGFVERSGVVVLGALSPRELRDVSRVVPLTDSEMEMVSGWSAPDSWIPGTRHPGRGKYLLKSGNRIGIPIETDYVGDEHELYNTDHMMLDPRLHQ